MIDMPYKGFKAIVISLELEAWLLSKKLYEGESPAKIIARLTRMPKQAKKG